MHVFYNFKECFVKAALAIHSELLLAGNFYKFTNIFMYIDFKSPTHPNSLFEKEAFVYVHASSDKYEMTE